LIWRGGEREEKKREARETSIKKDAAVVERSCEYFTPR
jgi:hypothetical protein